VIARTTAVIEPGGVLGELACAPPLTLRQVHSDVRDRCELRLVGTAAGPLAGDDLSVRLQLRPGARATLRATGASVAQGRAQPDQHGQDQHGRDQHGQDQHGRDQHGRDQHGRGDGAVLPVPATLAIRAELAAGADLVADPGALIVCRGSRIDVRVELALADGAAVEWRELIVLGRTGEPPGAVTLRWDVTRLGRPVLRQCVDLAGPALIRRAGLTARRRVLACALIADPMSRPLTAVASATAAAQRIDDHTLLVTVLDDDAASAAGQLDELCTRARG
jgi:urease accessory protein